MRQKTSIGGITLLCIAVVFLFLIKKDTPPDISMGRNAPPDITRLMYLSGEGIECGVKIVAYDGDKKYFIIYVTYEGEWFLIISGDNGDARRIWIDFNHDGIADDYYEGEASFIDLKEKYLKSCDILKTILAFIPASTNQLTGKNINTPLAWFLKS